MLATGLCATLAVSAITTTGCKKNDKKGPDQEEQTGKVLDLDPGQELNLDKNVKGDVSIMLWSGDSEYHEDLGHSGMTKDDVTAQNVAAVLAVATAFNRVYPNIKINLYAKSGDPDQEGITWEQEMENFKTQHGKYPDIWASTDVPNDVKKGLVADLSVYKDLNVYKQFNSTMMNYINYYGFQAGLPSYALPWGVYVNKSLASNNNIEIPSPDWTIDEYTEFATSGDGETFWGSMNCPTSFINTGTKDINAMIANPDRKPGDSYVDLTSDAVKELLDYIPQWAEDSFNAQLGLGNISEEIAQEGGYWSWNYFCNNRLLTDDTDPWMMASAADPDAYQGGGTVQADDWDIYPRPATDYCDTTVGLVIDPICLHNYALDDKKNEWSDSEKEQLAITFLFASYWTASTEARQAIADQQYKVGRSYKSAANDSFPVVSDKDTYNKQMDIWFSVPIHKRYADEEKMPGFQEVVKIFGDPERTWDYSDKCFPCTVVEDGAKKRCLYEWENSWDGEIAGSYQTEPNWANDVKSRLADWNQLANERFATADEQLRDALKEYYGKTDADFK